MTIPFLVVTVAVIVHRPRTKIRRTSLSFLHLLDLLSDWAIFIQCLPFSSHWVWRSELEPSALELYSLLNLLSSTFDCQLSFLDHRHTFPSNNITTASNFFVLVRVFGHRCVHQPRVHPSVMNAFISHEFVFLLQTHSYIDERAPLLFFLHIPHILWCIFLKTHPCQWSLLGYASPA